MSYIAPAGTRLSFADLFAGLGTGLLRPGAIDDLSKLLGAHAAQSHCWPMVSGRAAMSLVFKAMARANGDARRREIVMPGYTCYSVPAAAERAGLRVRLIDVDPATLDMDLDALRRVDFSSVLAVVTANLYGVPNSLPAIEQVAAEHGVYLLDDSAQSLGARMAGRAVGGYGDAGLYSFDKGKVITTMQGGAIVARAGALASAIAAEHAALPGAGFIETTSYALKLGVYGALLRPSLYGLVLRIPGLGLGQTRYEVDCPMTRYSTVLSGLALRLARRLDSINRVRVENARRYDAALAGVPGIRLLKLLPGAEAVYTRYPVFVNDPGRRAALIDKLNAAGIGATASYPLALADVPEVQALIGEGSAANPGARAVAESIFTLPTHAYSPPDLATRVRAIIDSLLNSTQP